MAGKSITPYKEVKDDQEIWRQFLKRYGNAQSVAQLWSALLEACYFYAIPSRNRFWRPKQQQGDQKNGRVYDTTPVEATKTFVSRMHEAMTPPQQQWGYLDIDESLNDEDEETITQAKLILDDYMKRLFNYIHESNFDVAVNECYFDLAIGTACIVVNEYTDEQPLLFTSIPLDKLAIEEAMTGRIESWYRTWDGVKINEIQVRWPNAVLTEDMRKRLEDNKDATIDTLYEGVMYMPQEEKPYCYMVGDTSGCVVKDAFKYNPGIVWRFQKVNNEVFGRGPVMDALPSIISLNEMARIELASANLNVFRPYMGFSDQVFNPYTFKIEPFTVIPIAPIGAGGQAPLIPLGDTSNPQFAQLTIVDLRNQIKTLLFNDVQSSESIQPQTAAEVLINRQNLAQKIGPLFSRLQQEFLWPLINRCADILEKRGLLPRPRLGNLKYNFRYKSPLALANAQQDIARFTQFYQILQGIVGAENAMIYINVKDMPWQLAEKMQVGIEFLNQPDAVQETGQNMQNRFDQMMLAQQNALETGEAA